MDKNDLPEGWGTPDEDNNGIETSPWGDVSQDDGENDSPETSKTASASFTQPSLTKPKPKPVLAIVGIVVALGLAFFGGIFVIDMFGGRDEIDSSGANRTSEPSEQPTIQPTVEPSPEPVVEPEDESWKAVYLDIVHKWESAYFDDIGVHGDERIFELELGAKYWLLYIDDNDVPELYVTWTAYYDTNSTLYTYHDKKAVLIFQSDHYQDRDFRGYVGKSGFTLHYSRDYLDQGGYEQVYDIYELNNGRYKLIESYRGYEEWQKQLEIKWLEMQDLGEGYSYDEILVLLGGDHVFIKE